MTDDVPSNAAPAGGEDVMIIEVAGVPTRVAVADIPAQIRERCPEYEVDQAKLWALDLPVQPVPVESLTWLLHLPVWPHQGRAFTLRPIDVVRNPADYPDRARRIHASSLCYPIEVVGHRDRLVVLDGCHRTCKAHLSGDQHIPARIVPRSRIPEIIDWNRTARSFDLDVYLARGELDGG